MDYINGLFETTQVTFEVAFLRMVMSFIAGGFIGWDRERRLQPAGLRTHILICMGATLVMLIYIFIPQTFTQFQNGDPGRIAAQAVTGIGFLGAGAILKMGVNIKGLTTAASIWITAALGLAIGCGLYMVSMISVGFILFVLWALDIFEKRMFIQKLSKTLKIRVKHNHFDVDYVKGILKKHKIAVTTVDVDSDIENLVKIYTFVIVFPEKVKLVNLEKDIETINNVISFKISTL
jgi:putative Mg2+ transporter-C (MgtC) family protein